MTIAHHFGAAQRRLGSSGAAATGSNRTLLLSAIGAIVGLGLAGYALFTAKGTSADGIPPEDVALVNQRPILQSDFVTQAQLETGNAFPETSPAERRKVLAEMIDEELLVQRGLEVDLAASDPDVRSALVAGVNLQVDAEVLAAPPDDAALRSYYTEHQDRYAIDGAMDLRDLVIPAAGRPAAAAAVTAIRAGTAVDAAAARFGLTDSGKIGRGDNYDFGVKAKLGETLYAAAATLADGQSTDPVEQDGEIHVLYMAKRKPIVPLGFAAARDTVWQDFQRDARARVERANLDYLKSRAEIRVAPRLQP
jgi:parvulin-like peptidyl-prolyl isomerase